MKTLDLHASPKHKIDVSPGDKVLLNLAVHNQSDETSTFLLDAQGVDETWINQKREKHLSAGKRDNLVCEVVVPLGTSPSDQAVPVSLMVMIDGTPSSDFPPMVVEFRVLPPVNPPQPTRPPTETGVDTTNGNTNAYTQVLPAVHVVTPPALCPPSQPTSPPPPNPSEPDPKAFAEHLIDPRQDEIVALRKDEAALVELVVVSGGQGGRCVVRARQADRPELDSPFVEVLGDSEVDAGAKMSVKFFLRITPRGMPPGDYRILVQRGPLNNQIATTIVLRVLPTLAVELSVNVERSEIKLGPIASKGEAPVIVCSKGNTGTAYRILARAISDSVDLKQAPSSWDLPPVEDWCVQLDKELENILPGDDRVNHRLRVQDISKTRWAVRRSCQVMIMAVPVTDTGNSGESGNATTIRVVRWFPFLVPTAWILLGLCLPLILLVSGFGISNVTVTNGAFNGNRYYVLQSRKKGWDDSAKDDVTLEAKVEWSSIMPFVRLNSTKSSLSWGAGAGTARFPLQKEHSGEERFWVSSILGLGGDSSLPVVFVPMRTSNKLFLNVDTLGQDGKYRKLLTETEISGGIRVGVDDKTYAATGIYPVVYAVPVHRGEEVFFRPTNKSNSVAIRFWLFETPKDYDVDGISSRDSTSSSDYKEAPPQGKGSAWHFKPRGDGPTKPTEAIVFTTNDPGSILRLRFIPIAP